MSERAEAATGGGAGGADGGGTDPSRTGTPDAPGGAEAGAGAGAAGDSDIDAISAGGDAREDAAEAEGSPAPAETGGPAPAEDSDAHGAPGDTADAAGAADSATPEDTANRADTGDAAEPAGAGNPADTTEATDTADATGSADSAGAAAAAPSETAARAAEVAATPAPGKARGRDHTGTSGRRGARAAAAEKGGRPRRRRTWLRWVAGGVGVVVLATAGAGWWFYQKLDGNITTDHEAASELQTYAKERPTPVALDALNILLIGSDSRSGKGNAKYGHDEGGTARSDTTILLHLAADRKSATAVSIPRDLMVHIPSCGKPGGTTTSAQFAQFNWAFQFGGTACTTRTVENLTGVRIDHEMVIDFSGFKDMVDAVGGVQVCLDKPVDDQEAHLKLPAGEQTVKGEQALGFVRARHGIGDGSDTERIERQQGFLGSLFTKLQSDGVLLNPTRLYPVLDAATKAITTDPGLDSLRDLYNLAHSMRDVPADKVQFLTVPQQPYGPDPNRDELVQSQAERLFRQLRDDAPVTVRTSGSPTDPGAGAGTSSGTPSGGPSDAPAESPTASGGKDSGKSAAGGSASAPASPGASGSPTPGPTFTGTNASVGLCE
ncbi:LCP family protein [Streptomyces fuscigenes]|uniref:LCP family protein n=1 Tax=Streptomyces fuscigenes TaxID=1528880 RepID=UPI001F3F0C4D|nr:LCP family protein [Streptomyces fuscigenes]MCF3960646.1 LCP family protein [Streptomyces fuscigenes]